MAHSDDIQQIMTLAAVRPDVSFRVYGVSRGAGYRAIANGDIPSFRVGNQLRIPTAPLREKLRLVESDLKSNAV